MPQKLSGKKLLEKEITLASYSGRDRIISSRELAEELKKTDDSVFIVPTGIDSLDRILGKGAEAGELVIVTGPTGEGKTTILMTITKNMSKAGVESTWFTLEVTPRQFLQKLMAGAEEGSSVPQFYIPRSGMEDTDDEYVKRWEVAHKRRYEMIDWIEDRIIESKVKVEKGGKQLKAIFIDHIHQIFELAKTNNQSLEIGHMVSRIKNMAIMYNLVIYLIAHTKDDPNGAMREPRKEDLRDSGLISRLADTIIGVWRISNENDGKSRRRDVLEEDDNKAKVAVFKNRRTGKNGWFLMYHVNHYLTENEQFSNSEFDRI